MVSRAEKNDKWLESEHKKLHNSTFPEDTTPFGRPTDVALHTFLDKFLEDYSWREDIFRDEIEVSVFNDGKRELSQQYKYDILRWLRKESYIHFTNVQDSGSVLVGSVKDIELYELLATLHPKIIPADIVYSPSTKIVIFNGKRHRMQQGDTYKIFHLLATNPNERITKAQIWRSINKRQTIKREVGSFSSLIARVRTSVGASNDEILLKDEVTLNGQVKISD